MKTSLARFLRRWLGWGGHPLHHLEVVMYSRKNCHLCDDALEHLRREQRHYRFRLEVVDVDADAMLKEEFGDIVPVISVGGEVRFRGRVNPVLLTRLLRAEAEKGKK